MKCFSAVRRATRLPANKNKLTSLLAAAVIVVASGSAHAAPPSSSSSSSAKLRGVDPAFYMQKRNHKPDVMVELKGQSADVAVAVLARPESFLVDAGQTKAQRDVELRALRQGALASLAERKDARAEALLTAHVDDADVLVAAVALERLGQLQTPSAVAVLAPVLNDTSAALERRAAAAAGLGRHRSAAALEVLLPALSDKDDELRISTLRALGALSSRWAWEARKDTATGDALRARALVAVSAVDGSPAVIAARAEVLGLLR